MRHILIILALTYVTYARPALAAEEFLTSAFRIVLPAEWRLERGGNTSTLLESWRRPDCEFDGRLYESAGGLLSLGWSANESYDHPSGSEGPITPLASYQRAIATWAEKISSGELTDALTEETNANGPLLRMTVVRGLRPKWNRKAVYVAAIRHDGFAVIDLLATPETDTESLVKSLLAQIINTDKAQIPPCGFRGKGGPALWRTWKNALQ